MIAGNPSGTCMDFLLKHERMYTELQVTTNFSFLRGGSHPDELVEQAASMGYEQVAITDHNTLAGIVRAYAAAKAKGIRIIPGCCLDLLDGPSLLAYPTDCTVSRLFAAGTSREKLPSMSVTVPRFVPFTEIPAPGKP